MLIDIFIGLAGVLSTWFLLIAVVVVPPPELPKVRG